MTNKKKDYQEPVLDVIKLRTPSLLCGSVPAEVDGSGARQYTFED
jgi:hypothetical protein